MLSRAILVAAPAIIVMYMFPPFSTPPHKVSVVTERLNTSYDYIIVGGGSAGSVLAARLSEDPDVTVLLLEAGGDYTENPGYHVPMNFGHFEHTDADWEFFTEPQEHCCMGMKDRRMNMAAGRVLGGTSILNAMTYVRGSRHDYDEWAELGCNGWSYDDILPYFLKSEDVQDEKLAGSKYHSKGGPLSVTTTDMCPIHQHYLKAGQDLGYPIVDYNAEEQQGFGHFQETVRNGIRSSTSVEFLGNTAGRANLHVGIRHLVTGVKIDNMTAKGVFSIHQGRKLLYEARKEVILSAGAINSPQLLMLSGIGPKDHLASLRIPVVKDLPVGKNLLNHMYVLLPTNINASIGLTQDAIESPWTALQYSVFGSGALSFMGADGLAFFCLGKKNTDVCRPDIQFQFYNKKFTYNFINLRDDIAGTVFPNDPNANAFTSLIILLHPESFGIVSLKTKDPFDPPSIDPRLLSSKTDVETLVKGIRIWEELLETPTMKAIGARVDPFRIEGCSQYELRSDSYWECIVRHVGSHYSHSVGTCKMGKVEDPTTVVDPELRVKDVSGLRVVDASVMPTIVSGNPVAAVIMIAEKAADLILAKSTVAEYPKRLVS